MTSMPGSSRTASICATSAREISAPVASPPACAIRSAWWPPSRVSEMRAVGRRVEHRAAGDQLAHARRALGDQHLDRARVAQPGAGDERVLQVRGGRVGRVQRRGDAALRPDRRPRRERVLGDQQDARHAGAQLERGGQPGDARADDDRVRLDDPARARARRAAWPGECGSPGGGARDRRHRRAVANGMPLGSRSAQPSGTCPGSSPEVDDAVVGVDEHDVGLVGRGPRRRTAARTR